MEMGEARQVDVASWEEALDGLVAEYGAIRGRGAWTQGPGDFFGVLGLGRAELAHSAMLAWLFNPDGRHGFGRMLLNRIIEGHIPDLDVSSFRVRGIDLEVQRSETRADIVVWGDAATLVIEVKVDAGEGHRQCDRLYDRFSTEPGVRFVFLTPSGRPPLTATGDAAGAFNNLSFQDVRQALEDVLEEAGDAGEATDIAKNYLRTLRVEFK